MADIEPFHLAVPDSELDKLRERLALTIFPDELQDAGTKLGRPVADVQRLVKYWQDGFDWRKIEASINQMPQFMTKIQVEGFDPLSIHFVHNKSPVPDAIPLLFIHGWPGNFLEVSKLVPLLAEGDGKKTPAFHVVALSLPNYGFSEGPKKLGFQLKQYAETCVKLMSKLGYLEFVAQGGDWGAHISRTIGYYYPDHCKAIHLNMVRTGPPSFFKNPLLALRYMVTPYSAWDKEGLKRSKWFEEDGSAYGFEQATRPQTLGYALADSPVGLLAWIYEKLVEWTDNYPWTDDEILTWVSVYWFSTAGPAANLRIYYERQHTKSPQYGIEGYIPKVKFGLAFFPKELYVVPPIWGDTFGTIVYRSVHKHGGHFAATEHPEIIAEDLRKMLGRGGGAFGAVKGKFGYTQG